MKKFFLIGLSTFCSCSYMDAKERTLPVVPGRGRVVLSSLSNNEISLLGNHLLYRFKSDPNILYIDENFEGLDGFTPIDRAVDLQTIALVSGKVPFPAENGDRQDAIVDGQTPFEQAGFDKALQSIHSLTLTPVKVAIIDSGVVAATPNLREALKTLTNFTLDDDISHWQNHATAIASVYSGVIEHGYRVHSFAPNAELASIKIAFSGDRPGTLREDLGSLQLAAAIDEAIAGGARIVNMSFTYQEGLPADVSMLERYLISRASQRGVLFVTAAGNDGVNLDDTPFYPARFDLNNVVVVGSHDAHAFRATSSNYGESVDISAPGVDVPATLKTGETSYFSGTSFAVPIVASALSLYFGVCPKASASEALSDMFTSASGNPSESVLSTRYGQINAGAFVKRALQKMENKNSCR